jgi:hypothetical protein
VTIRKNREFRRKGIFTKEEFLEMAKVVNKEMNRKEL